MKAKRQKHVRNVLSFYRNNFRLKVPYHMLVDGTLCRAALKEQVNISDQVPKYLGSEVSFFTTSCVLAECQAFGTMLYGPLKVLQQFSCYDCKHSPPKLATKCLMSVLRKHKRRFIIATQDPNLRESVHELAGVPLLYIAHKTVILEPPSDKSKEVAAAKKAARTGLEPHEQRTLRELKEAMFGPQDSGKKKRKRKGPKGPNPLSCKKKKKKTAGASPTDAAEGKKRKRRKKKGGKQTESLKAAVSEAS